MLLETTARAIDTFRRRPRPLHLVCAVQHYDWGDPVAIPRLLGRPNSRGRPFAELWAGAHSDLPSSALVAGVRIPLDELVREAPDEVLGHRVAALFGGELPFLLKILAARKPLSIQAHPSSTQALQGFERENRQGLPLNAATRSYRDPNHKPELLVALTDFYALRGFRPLCEIAKALARTPELSLLAQQLGETGSDLRALYEHLLRLDQDVVNTLLDPLVERLQREEQRNAFQQSEAAHWILRADQEFSTPGRRDPGILSMFLLNLVHLRPGQAIYLPAGELHSYLQGVGVEIMASSNNVLRGGLTHKHVDAEELLRILTFRAAPVQVLEGETVPGAPVLVSYSTPAKEFELTRLEVPAGRKFLLGGDGPTLALLSGGSVEMAGAGTHPEKVRSGEAILVPAGLTCKVTGIEDAVVWRAGVPGR